jgi:cytochrome b subunit of formate dehydrogenase/mono/diheme cytochrome c family protein
MATEKSAPMPSRMYTRFDLSSRIQHVIMLLSFTALAVTGLVQKFALNPISVSIVGLWGGIENVRATHHVAATMLMLVAIYHLVEIGYKVFVLRLRLSMLPGLQDIRDAWNALTYNVGLGKSRPQFGRYGFEEKAEYWALVWGIVIMGLTGFMMWNPLATINILPGEFIPAAKLAHGAEAVLAVLAIIVWHMYGVHLRRFNKAMWTGKLTEEEMLHEHPLELADIKAGAEQVPPPGVVRKRRLIYYPIAVLVAGSLLFAVYGFVGSEQTAITTLPPAISTVPVFVPQTPTSLPPTPTAKPSATAAPTSEGTAAPGTAVTWADVAPIFAGRCVMCHGAALASKGLALDAYGNALKGGQDGSVLIAGDPTGSKLIVVQSAGGHPGQLSPEELELVGQWIATGALER